MTSATTANTSPLVLSIDAGTTGVTVLAIDANSTINARGYCEFEQKYPEPGWVSHDPEAIWDATIKACTETLKSIDQSRIVGIGITNQRETTVVWDRQTGKPIDDAIVWQCRRTADRCDKLRAEGLEPLIRRRTGLVLDAYFSATKIEWMLDNNDGARHATQEGRLAFGTIDSWLVHKMTGGQQHVTDSSNASRTSLFSLQDLCWDQELCDVFNVPMSVLPNVVDSSGAIATTEPSEFFGLKIPVAGIAGDQQAALFGQGCHTKGRSKCTYGTGSFLLLNCGNEPVESPQGLLSTVAWTINGETTFALEGAIFITGASLTWMRDELHTITDYNEAEPLALTVKSSEGVYLVPAFAGLGSPWWDASARGLITGLTRGSSRAHIMRAAIDAMAHQTCDVLEAMSAASKTAAVDLRVDGGAVRMDLLCQTVSDLCEMEVLRPVNQESTAMGAAYLAGLHLGMWDSPAAIDSAWLLDKAFSPASGESNRESQRKGWHQALSAARGLNTNNS